MPRVLYLITVDVAPASEAAWNAWYTRNQVPQMLRQPGFLSARRFREPGPLSDGWLRYLVLYELDSPAALADHERSEAARQLRADHDTQFGDVTRVARRVLHEVDGTAIQDPYEGI